jgi:hypothetical protein
MKNLITGMVLLLLCASFAFSVQEPAKWIDYASTEGRYNISLPVQPTLKTQESTTADGEKFPQYLAIAADAQLTFLIGYFDVMPGSTFSGDLARDAMVKKISGKVLSESPITLGSYPGRDLKVALSLSIPAADGRPASQIDYVDRMRMYEANKRIYILQAFYPKAMEAEVGAQVSKYFDSFQVVKN